MHIIDALEYVASLPSGRCIIAVAGPGESAKIRRTPNGFILTYRGQTREYRFLEPQSRVRRGIDQPS